MSYHKIWHAVKNPPLDSTNPHYKSKFSSLEAVEKVIREATPDGEAVICAPRFYDGVCVFVVTHIQEDGASEILLELPVNLPTDPQKVLAFITYMRRGCLCAALGIVGEEDDDGNTAAGVGEKKHPKDLTAKQAELSEALIDTARKHEVTVKALTTLVTMEFGPSPRDYSDAECQAAVLWLHEWDGEA